MNAASFRIVDPVRFRAGLKKLIILLRFAGSRWLWIQNERASPHDRRAATDTVEHVDKESQISRASFIDCKFPRGRRLRIIDLFDGPRFAIDQRAQLRS